MSPLVSPNSVTPLLALTRPSPKTCAAPDALAHVLGLDLDVLDQAVTLTGAQTLTNKTLTAPVLTSPSVLTGDLTLTAGRLVITTAASKIVPGATSLSLRNHADGADNLLLTDAGLATFRNTVTAPTFVGNLTGNATTATFATTSGGAAPTGAAGGDLAGTFPNPTLGAIGAATGPLGSSTVAPIVTIDAKGRVTALSSATITGVVPGGAAGGDLAGTYPSPTLAVLGTATGPIGSTSVVPVVTIDTKGRVTALTSATLVAPAGTLTGATLAAGVLASSLTSVGVLAAPHMTSPVVDSGGLTVTAGGATVTGNSTITGTLTTTGTINGQTISAAAAFTGTLTAATSMSVTAGAVNLGGTGANVVRGTGAGGSIVIRPNTGGFFVNNDANTVNNLILTDAGVMTIAAGLIVAAGGARIGGLGAFAASDKYVVVDASGNLHKSALGPAS